MSSIWHENALKAVQDNLLGSRIVEVVHKVPWGFDEIDRQVVAALDFALVEQERCDTCILHILAGEGVSPDVIDKVLRMALRMSTRILVLEHNPQCDSFAKSLSVKEKSLEAIKRIIRLEGYAVTEHDIDGRNILYCVTAIEGVDESFNRVNNKNLEKMLSFQFEDGLPEKDRNIFCMSSEKQPDSDRILSEDTAMFIDSLDGEAGIYSVVGGMMFLNILAELAVVRKIVLFDLSLPQMLFAVLVVELIRQNETIEEFDSATTRTTQTLDKLLSFCDVDVFIDWFFTSIEKLINPAKGLRWINLIKLGHWRKQYDEVRAYVLADKIGYHLGGFPEIDVPDGSVLYTSTITQGFYANLKECHIVEAFSERDVPKLVKL